MLKNDLVCIIKKNVNVELKGQIRETPWCMLRRLVSRVSLHNSKNRSGHFVKIQRCLLCLPGVFMYAGYQQLTIKLDYRLSYLYHRECYTSCHNHKYTNSFVHAYFPHAGNKTSCYILCIYTYTQQVCLLCSPSIHTSTTPHQTRHNQLL